MERMNHMISVYAPNISFLEVQQHFEKFGHIAGVYPWRSKGSRVHYFVEFDSVPNLVAIKNSSLGLMISRVHSTHLSAKFKDFSDSQSQKRSFDDIIRECYPQERDNEPHDHQKRPKIAGKDHVSDYTTQDIIGQPKDSAAAIGRTTSLRATCSTGSGIQSDPEVGDSHSVGMAQWVKDDCQALATPLQSKALKLTTNLRGLAPKLTGSNLVPLEPRVCVSAASKAIVTSFINAGGPLRENSFEPTSADEENRYPATPFGNQRTKQANEYNGRKSKTPKTRNNKSAISALQAAQNSLREAENALREEREKGKGLQDQFTSLTQQLNPMQEVVDGMHKRILKEVEARRAVEERLSQESETWKRRGDSIKLLLDQIAKALEETVAVEPCLSTRETSIQPTISCKQEPVE